jgi:alkanesulfonate monooxygenase SsuD/methylene tetrahydromethanopterin reductase-like flavin-dependent oxidoreductase (luciferase family)
VEAGERGLGVLGFILAQPTALSERISLYREAIARAQPVGAFVNNQVAGFTVSLCLDDDAEAQRIGGPAALWYTAQLSAILGEWRGQHIPGYEYYGRINQAAQEQANPAMTTLIENGTFCIGDPDRCTAIIRKYEAVGVDQIMCFMQAGRIPHEKIMRSIELFGTKVIPHFRGNGAERQRNAEERA